PSEPRPAIRRSLEDRAAASLGAWDRRAQASDSDLERAACAALTRVVNALIRHRGRLVADKALLARLAG
ncbi:hypothetical protein, partial [Escherichia coli]|uniref:hypothetical protein n=1 Tax=Escherichia coli TaxID=562 RepID=UPI001954A474